MALKHFVEGMGIHSMLKHMCFSIECSMYNGVSSFLFQNTIIPIQVTLFGMHHYSHVLPTDYNPYSANLAGVHDRSLVPSQSFSKAFVSTVIAVKVLGMLQHTNPLALNKKLILRDFYLV